MLSNLILIQNLLFLSSYVSAYPNFSEKKLKEKYFSRVKLGNVCTVKALGTNKIVSIFYSFQIL